MFSSSQFVFQEGRTRWRRIAFYSIILVEDTILVGIWYPYRAVDNETANTSLLVTSVVGFFLGKNITNWIKKMIVLFSVLIRFQAVLT